MPASVSSKPFLRIPPWLKQSLPQGRTFCETNSLMDTLALHTVCSSAKCPNKFACFSAGTATFLLMGNVCTRNCAFCNITPGMPEALPLDEPQRVASAAKTMGLKHVVLTSVTRDDLTDGGAGHFAATIRAVQAALAAASIEVLIPDFNGSASALQLVIDAQPHIINHNLETPPAQYSRIRPQANYAQSLELLGRVKEAGLVSKSGIMLGLGESDAEVYAVLEDLCAIGCDIVTIGQYMQPSLQHPAVQRYVHPDVFTEYATFGQALGIPFVYSAPLVRSSFNADSAYASLRLRQAEHSL